MGDSFLDSVQGLKELIIFHADEAQHMKMNETSEEFRKITMKVLVMQLASTTIMDLIAYGGAGLGIAFAVLGVVNRGLPPISALFLILVAVDFFLPLRAFGSAFHVAMNGASAGKKILSLLEQPDPVWGKEVPDDTELRLENVTFSYDSHRDVLKDVTMAFPKTGMTAIVGESGCGKSTVVNMLCGALRPRKGRVTVGDKLLESLSREAYYAELALAVALVADKSIYIFDEATSNIDIESEAIITKNIRALAKRKSVIVISHRLANVVPADCIYYMEAGEIRETGSHDALMKRSGGYARLYTAQKKLEEGYKEVTGNG